MRSTRHCESKADCAQTPTSTRAGPPLPVKPRELAILALPPNSTPCGKHHTITHHARRIRTRLQPGPLGQRLRCHAHKTQSPESEPCGSRESLQAAGRSPAAPTDSRSGASPGASRLAAGVPNGSRTRVAALKGRSPRPLDDGDVASGPGNIARTRSGAQSPHEKRPSARELQHHRRPRGPPSTPAEPGEQPAAQKPRRRAQIELASPDAPELPAAHMGAPRPPTRPGRGRNGDPGRGAGPAPGPHPPRPDPTGVPAPGA